MSRADFEQEVAHGSLYLGSPETVARKIAATAKGSACRASSSNTAPVRWRMRS